MKLVLESGSAVSRKEREPRHFYRAYGLTIQSALCLPELVPTAEASPDVRIRLGPVECPLLKDGGIEENFHLVENDVCFWWEQVAAFRVRQGSEIIIEPVLGAEERLVRLPLLGVVMAVLLHQRGALVLHGSAVALDGQAVVFLGGKGYGKSTTAASLYRRGHDFLADDIVAVDLSSTSEVLVFPGFPQMKLWPEASSALGDDPELFPQLAPNYEKRARGIHERFSDQITPIHGIYALDEGLTLAVSRMAPGESLQTLIANSYVARFGRQMLQNREGSSHFAQCIKLLQRVPVWRLARPRSLQLLGETACLVEEHASRSRATRPEERSS
jgi:hypothetical protein